ncbi:hypothetical protein EJD97_001557, partial [Solanum chilense]
FIIGKNTLRTAAQRLVEKIANVGVPPFGNKDPLLEKVANDDHVLVNPSLLKDGDIREASLKMPLPITTKAKVVTTQTQDMTAKTNLEVVPRANQHVGTMASRLRDITWMNPPTFYKTKVEEDRQEFID